MSSDGFGMSSEIRVVVGKARVAFGIVLKSSGGRRSGFGIRKVRVVVVCD